MTLKPMYPAAVNSPATELAADITATATKITVLSTNGLPDAPNLLTLGSDETAETVRYTKIDGMKLTVERGFQGVAKSWSAGTRVARYFTAYDHETFRENIEAIDGETSGAERVGLTLSPGMQIVESAQDTPFQMGEVKGRTEIREGDGIVNVKNPYAIVTGGNLLPPFYEWNGGTSGIFLEPYTQKVVSTGDRMNSATQILAVQGETYTLCMEREGDGEIGLDFRDEHNDVLWTSGFVKQDSITAIAPQGTTYVNTWTSAPAAGEFIFRNPMLTVGTEPKSFVSQQRSMLAFETELAANPVDGSNPDTLFMGDDGLPYVLEKWGKEILSGQSQWNLIATYSGFKQLGKANHKYPITGHQGLIVKYDGSLLQNFSGVPSGSDMGTISQNSGDVHITISNTDSGWGPEYEPSREEIKAYFLGWRMYDTSTTAYNEPYNRTDGAYKGWVRRNDEGNPVDATGNMPTTQAPINAAWQPYRLQYLKAKPTVKPVRNYEVGATLSAGSNMVEVGSGIVIREKANPQPAGTSWVINRIEQPNSLLKYPSNNMMFLYENNYEKHGFTRNINLPATYWGGSGYSTAGAQGVYEPTAVYHVTYTMLDPTLAAPISGTVAANLRGTVSDLVQDVGDIGRRLSVVETQKAEKDNAVVWIKPSLINGWEYFGYGATPGYTKIGNVVHIKGKLRNGTPGTAVFRLPSGYRPKEALLFLCRAYDAGNRPVTVGVDPNGDVSVYDTNMEIHLDGTVFIAEQ